MSIAASWTIDDQLTARLNTERLACKIDLKYPSLGLREIEAAGKRLVGISPLQISATPALPEGEQLAECYVRGTDLIAEYRQAPGRSARPAVYWRYLDGDQYGSAIEVIISMETDHLSSDPRVTLVSHFSSVLDLSYLHAEHDDLFASVKPVSNEPTQLNLTDIQPLCLVRMGDEPLQYGEAIHPTDFAGVQIAREGETLVVRYELFAESLEKGVIRRGRALAAFVPAGCAEAAMVHWYGTMQQASPPLTA